MGASGCVLSGIKWPRCPRTLAVGSLAQYRRPQGVACCQAHMRASGCVLSGIKWPRRPRTLPVGSLAQYRRPRGVATGVLGAC
jgi:hypothetical protein